MSKTLSPRQLARVIGASESSLKRWADEGMLKVVRTAGGHRRITVEEAIRFVRVQGFHVVEPAALGLSEVRSSRATAGENLPAILAQHLIDGDHKSFKGTLIERYLTGESVATLGDRYLSHAMVAVGDIYRHEGQGLFIEHRATEMCLEILHTLQSLIRRSRPNTSGDEQISGERPVALGGAVSGDPYRIPSLLVSCVLLEVGYDTVNLGPELPIESLWDAVEAYTPRVVWLACSVESAALESRAINRLGEQLHERGAALAVGGRGFAERKGLENDQVQYCDSMRELSAFARGLHN
jgi:methanogenic corrinoid protein MtbC1